MSDMNLWIHENQEDFLSIQYRVEKTLFSERSDYQKIDVVETRGHGKMLFIDSLVMISERDEFVYHDMIAHVPLFTHPDPRRVLIIGGGDGGTAREVLRHERVERVVQVEIDALVVEACRQYIPQTACAYENPKLELMIRDGVAYMKETDDRFDVIIVDSTDPIGPAAPLFGEAFYQSVHRVLTDSGVVVAQGESTFYHVAEQQSILKSMRSSFDHVFLYNYNNLTYPGGLWSFAMASKGPHPLADFDSGRVVGSGLSFSYYTPAIHRAAFCLPGFQTAEIGSFLSDQDPFAH